MAIDTAAKRFAMLDIASGPAVHVRLFEVDGAVDADDRAFLLKIYGGNALGAVAAVVDVICLADWALNVAVLDDVALNVAVLDTVDLKVAVLDDVALEC